MVWCENVQMSDKWFFMVGVWNLVESGIGILLICVFFFFCQGNYNVL